MARILIAMLFVASLGSFGSVAAQTIPTKTISIYNNSDTDTIFPVIQAPIMKGLTTPVHDLWMQALFDVKNVETQIFNTTLLYKVYVNKKSGIAPHHFVTLKIPFYTQLLPTNEDDLGKVDDQFIDWWNAMRIFVFDGSTAINAAYNYSVDRSGRVIPPIAVDPAAGAAVPSCASESADCEPVVIKAYVNGFPTSIPAQLVEYTFAAAEGPPLNPDLSINTNIVNFNISAVDQVYLPAAIGASGNSTDKNTFLGSIEPLATFRPGLNAFAANGALWPVYVPAYYTAENPTIPLPDPPPGSEPYPLPQIPSTNTVYAELFRDPPPAPPVLSSDTLNGIGDLGMVAQGTLNLWKKCTASMTDGTATCQHIRQVNEFFVADYHQCFPHAPLPGTEDFLRDVYGWVQFPGCSTPLSSAPGYAEAIETYCTLQYNFFDKSVLPEYIFNPYVRLIHDTIPFTLASNAYAFSIDDAVSFKSLPGDGIIVTIAGANGLENKTQTPLPTPSTYKTYCRSS